MTEPPPPELAELFAAEKVAPAATQTARIVLRARIAQSVAHLPLGAGAAVGVGKMLAILAVVVGAGTGTYAVVRQHAPVAAIVAPASPSVAATPSPSPTVEAAAPAVAPVVPPVVSVDAPAPRIVQAKPTLSMPAPAPSPSEATLLAQAWSALESNAGHALELAHRDEALHPEGALREEREALEVVALAKLQRRSDAVAAASEFFKQHPSSVHRALVERSLRSEPSP